MRPRRQQRPADLDGDPDSRPPSSTFRSEAAAATATTAGNSSFLSGGSCAFAVCENQLVMLIGGGASASTAGRGGAGGAGARAGQAAGRLAAAAKISVTYTCNPVLKAGLHNILYEAARGAQQQHLH